MHDQLHGLTGPDFLDKVADAEAANSNDINAAVYRERSRQWQRDQQRLEQLETENAALQRKLARAAGALAA